MTESLIHEEAEQIVRGLSQTLLEPKSHECLVCYVSRQLTQFGCDTTHRFALRYQDRAAPRATALLPRLAQMGACCCDCEILLNAYEPARHLGSVDPVPPCLGVRHGSTQPCGYWVHVRRGRFRA